MLRLRPADCNSGYFKILQDGAYPDRREAIALDCRYVVNPDCVVARIQSCTAFGPSAAL